MEKDKLENQLLSISEGFSLDELIEEAMFEDRDSLPGMIMDISNTLETLENEQTEKNRQFGVTKKEYLDMVSGNSTAASDAALQSRIIIADMQNKIEEYITLRRAHIALKKGLERYRKENEVFIIKRASEIFSRITLKRFSRLEVDYDQNDNPVLVGIRSNEEKVMVGDMSDGTQDQLYLALRLASLEQHIDSNEPVPFILDDILVNFDDERAQETLSVLSELAQKTQVIFFTHHEHIVTIAKEAIRKDFLEVHSISA